MCLGSNGISLQVVLYLSHYLDLNFGALLYVYKLCQTRTADVVDVVYVNIVT